MSESEAKYISNLLNGELWRVNTLITQATRSGFLDPPVEGQLSKRAEDIISNAFFRPAVLLRESCREQGLLEEVLLRHLPKYLRAELAELKCISEGELTILDAAISNMHGIASCARDLPPSAQVCWTNEDGTCSPEFQLAHRLYFIARRIAGSRKTIGAADDREMSKLTAENDLTDNGITAPAPNVLGNSISSEVSAEHFVDYAGDRCELLKLWKDKTRETHKVLQERAGLPSGETGRSILKKWRKSIAYKDGSRVDIRIRRAIQNDMT